MYIGRNGVSFIADNSPTARNTDWEMMNTGRKGMAFSADNSSTAGVVNGSEVIDHFVNTTGLLIPQVAVDPAHIFSYG